MTSCANRGPIIGVLGLLLGVGGVACSGNSNPGVSDGADEGDGAGGGDDGSNGGGGSGPAVVPGACKLPDDKLPPTRVWRLSSQQYANTMSKLFGVNVDGSKLPDEGASSEKFAVFDTFDKAVVFEEFATAVASEAENAAKSLGAQAIKDKSCLGDAKPAADCVDDFVSTFGEKAFRRPLDSDEKMRFSGLFNDEAGKRGGASATALVIEAMLQSPRFLYRTELGTGSGKRIGLTQFELASQLSYLLTDGPPDADLLSAAKDGKLKDAAAVRDHAARLIDGPGARAKFVDFWQQLVAVKGLDTVAKDTTVFPDFSEDVRQAMMTETRTFVEKTLFDDKAGVGTLFDANYTYVNAKLAPLYGMSASGLGGDFKKTNLPSERKGILSQGGVLTASGHPDGTSPTLRGLFIYQRLLCNEKPDPPAGAADKAAGKLFDPASPKNTQREHYEFAQKNAPECMACHATFMPFGLGLEQFDGIGKYRTKEFDKTIDTSLVVKNLGDGLDGSYKDTLEFGGKMMNSTQARECLVMQTATFGFGRLVDKDEQSCEIEQVAAKVGKNGLKFQDVLIELTQLDSFFNRQPAPQQ